MEAKSANTKAAGGDGFAVAGWMDRVGEFVTRHRRLWISLGNIETKAVLAERAGEAIDRPIYIAGLARSGSTILLETLARHPEVATHRYRDYPLIFTPYWWNRWLDRVARQDERPVERTHRDGIAITSNSPEAFEEMLWMAFFPGLHDPSHRASLDDPAADHRGFARFYVDHIRKLLAVRGRRRYVAKGNYNVTRLGYLLRLFPDARFVVPVRDPVWHIASLMKQQALFAKGQHDNPAAVRHLQRVGHFEFGLDRRAIAIGDPRRVAEVTALWQGGAEVEGWARYWTLIHDHVADVLAGSPEIRAATRVVRYEDLCQTPRQTIAEALSHCGLAAGEGFLAEAAERIRFPGYYKPKFTDAELAVIERETAPTARKFGYGSPVNDSRPIARRSQ
ncbi:sulfotransferase [Shumkonia mesophila]|uniref:sulfotransferase n=1 Tax=Shumkonia mesophila TaxID=2838854 RepID=UPI002934C8D9|nr:sulfotransferase [Shumkonia mesophila]